MNDITFEEFYAKFGLESYPFNSFTAENETEKQPALFVTTKLYSPIVQAFKEGQTLLITGDRGTGKTSILYDFARHSPANTIFCKVDDFSELDKGYTEAELYKFVIRAISNEFFSSAAKVNFYHDKLTDDERVLLAYFYSNFASDATRGLAQRAVRKIQVSPAKRAGIALYNFIRNPLNMLGHAGATLLADIIAKSTGGTPIASQAVEYFPEIAAGIESDFPKPEATYEALRRLNELVRKSGYNRVVVVFDKIDEDARFENAAENISEFIEPILSNNKLLLDDTFQLVFSLWVVPLNFIRDKVRTQKISSPSLKWQHDDLKRAYDRRIEVFSRNSQSKFSDVFKIDVSDELKTEVLELSNGNPRDLWHLFNHIFRCQYSRNSSATKISKVACEEGMVNFVKQFNLYEYYPRKANARANSMDVYAYVKHLLKLEAATFTRNQLNDRAGTGSSTLNYTVGMENLGLIDKETTDRGENQYWIRDPKVRFALEKQIEIKKPQ